jgi:hypothetical protein
MIRVFLNEGTDAAPDFTSVIFVQDSGSNLDIPAGRSSPAVEDLDGDGKKDLLSGDTNGQLLLYLNTGSDEAPSFSGFSLVQAAGVPIDLPGVPRSRPFVCDWTGDGLPDILIGAGDGLVRLYRGRAPIPTVSPWGLDAMAILLVAIAGRVFTRAKRQAS